MNSLLSDWRWEKVVSWGTRGGLAVLDQGLFSGANFLVNILLARWLPPEEYGAFAVALSIFYLLAGFHTAVLTEPMMVFGAGKYHKHFREYLGVVLWGHLGISVFLLLGLGISAWVFRGRGSLDMARSLLGLAIALPFLLSLWFTRRAFYVRTQPAWAVLGSGLNLLGVLGGLSLLWYFTKISSFNVFLALGINAAVASFILLLRLRPQIAGRWAIFNLYKVFTEHRKFGQWNIVAFGAYWASGQIILLLIPAFLGFSEAGAVAAVLVLFRPLTLVLSSLSTMMLPVFARWVQEGSILGKRGVLMVTMFGGAALVYGLIIDTFSFQILNFLYGGKYNHYWTLTILFTMSTTASAVLWVLVSLLKAQQRVKEVAFIWTFSAGVVLVSGIPLLLMWRTRGAITSLAVAYIVASVVAFYRFYLLERRL